MGRAGGYSDGRDIGAVFNFPNADGASALPMCGGVGAQYTPTAGYAQAIDYQKNVLGDRAYDGAMGVVLGGGVAGNRTLAAAVQARVRRLGATVFAPSARLATDNAAMIARAGLYHFEQGERSPLDLNAFASLPIPGLVSA